MRRTPLLFRPPSSAIDATRFTSTSPHAFSKPPVRSSRPSASTFSPSASPSYTPQKPPPSLSSRPLPSSNPSSNLKTTPTLTSKSGPTIRNEAAADRAGRTPGGGPVPPEAETPAQKVARLRAARAAAKEQIQTSRWDRIVVAGREWADRLHRIFTIGLILLTVIAGLVTLYAVASMITYNRKKRNAFYADQIRSQQELVMAAIEAEKAGLPMTEEQQLMLNREKARFQAEELRKAKPGFMKRVLAPITGRFGGGEEGNAAEKAEETVVQRSEQKKAAERGDVAAERSGREGMVEAFKHGERKVEKGLKETAEENLRSGGKEAEAAVLGGFEKARRREAGNPTVAYGVPVDNVAEAETVTETGKSRGGG